MIRHSFKDQAPEDRIALQEFYSFLKEIVQFQNNSNQKTFKFVFGEKLGQVEWEHFVTKAHRNIFTFLADCLTKEQAADLLINIYKYRSATDANMLYSL